MRPILLPNTSVNQSAPSGPVVMTTRKLFGVGTWNSVMAPSVVIRPILWAVFLILHCISV